MAPPDTSRRRLWTRRFLPASAAALVIAAALSPATLFNALARVQDDEFVGDIPYAEGGRRRLDVYRAGQASRAPVIVFFYGGSWQSGAKEIYRFLAVALTARGYVVVIPDYRVYPDVRFPDFLGDGASALRWTHERVHEFGGDPERIFVMGHSAGAYIAAMLALDGSWLRSVGLDPVRDIAGLIGLGGPYDFLPLHDPVLKRIFDGDRAETQPITYAQGRKPPALLAAGAADTTVDPANSLRLAARLRSFGNDATDLFYRRTGHIGILGGFAPFIGGAFPLLRDIDHFVGRTRGGTPQQIAAAEPA